MRIYTPEYYDSVKVVEIPKDEIMLVDFAKCLEPTETLEKFYKRQVTKPTILINGGLFNMSNGTTCFNFVDEKEKISYIPDFKFGMGIVGTNRLVYDHMEYMPDIRDFLSAYPPLIVKGQKADITFAKELDYKARRTVLAYGSKFVYIVIWDNPGCKFFALQEILSQLDIDYAINLDGGGSTRMLVNGKLATDEQWSRPVDNVVAFYLKAAEPELYRVQVGAYRIKSNAEGVCNDIRALPDTIAAGYKNAYIRLIDGLYKVQVGAFSVKENAQKVLDDLKENHGVTGFISNK